MSRFVQSWLAYFRLFLDWKFYALIFFVWFLYKQLMV